MGKRNQELGSLIGFCNVTVTAFIFFIDLSVVVSMVAATPVGPQVN